MRRARPFDLLVLALLVLAPALPAVAQDIAGVSIAIDPAAPTWQDEVVVTVSGEESCGNVGATGEVDFVIGVGPVLRVHLDQSCVIDPPMTLPFETTVAFDDLDPAVYTVKVSAYPDDEPVLAETELTVHAVADLEIELPAMPPTDDAPFVISVSGVTNGCSSPDPAEVEDGVIVLHFPDDDCAVLPPGGGVQTFDYSVGPLPAGDYEIRVFRHAFTSVPQLARAVVRVYDAELCLPESDVLCLNQSRFAVRVQWRDFQGHEGVGQALPFTDDTGMFWFFDPENVELTIKVLTACPIDGHFWVFVASGSTVEYEIRVTDTIDDETRFYRNASGEVPALIPDTGAFACP